MSSRPMRVTTRVLPNGEVIVIVEPIIDAVSQIALIGEDRNREVHVGKIGACTPELSGVHPSLSAPNSI